MHELHLTPLDIHFLRDVDHVANAIGAEERLLRAENRVLTDALASREAELAGSKAEVARLDRQRRILYGCIVALLVACVWLGWLAGEAGR